MQDFTRELLNNYFASLIKDDPDLALKIMLECNDKMKAQEEQNALMKTELRSISMALHRGGIPLNVDEIDETLNKVNEMRGL